jgi:DNA polymerase
MHRIKPRPERFHHDFETYSDLDVTKVGASRYARHESTEPLMLAYAFDDRRVKQWVPAEGQPMPAEVEDTMLDNRIKKFAWNKNFEWHIWKYSLGIDTPHTAWRDPMVMALSLSLPGKLLKCGQVLRLPEKYLKQDGHRLINWFSKKRPATKTKPVRRVHWHEKYDKWVEFLEYNRMDVISERKIYRILKPYDLPEHEWELWALDQEINARGFPVNMEMCRNVIEVRDELVQDRIDELEEITGLDNPNAQAQLLGWLRDNGYPFDDLKAGHIRRAMEKYDRIVERGDRPNQSEDYRRVLELRSEVSRTSTKKFDAVASHTDDDGYLRNCFQFAGAGRTWRWAGRVFQPQNLARPTKELEGLTWGTTPGGHKYVTGGTQIEAARLLQDLTAEGVDMLFDRPMDAISGAVRTVVQAPKGYVFIDADLAAIENVVLGWMSGDRRILRVFEKGLDPYIDFATYLYKREYASLWAEYQAGNKGRRTIAKPGVLGCGYMLSAGKQYENRQTGEIEATGLLGYAWNMGVKLTPEQADLSVRVWRETYRKAVQFWYDLQRAAFKCMRTKKEVACGPVSFDRTGPFLRMNLPSGRSLHYLRPKLEEVLAPWGDYKMSLTYEGLNDKYQWDRISTHPGKLTENGDQAISRDILSAGMRKAAKAGIPVVMHVHDQIVGLVKEEDADDGLATLIQCMTDRDEWMGTIPLKVAGHISTHFVKD